MGLFEQTQARFTKAQSILARIQGSDNAPDGVNNVLINGSPYLGVWGNATVQDVISVGGGYSRLGSLTLTITRAQLATPPVEKTSTVTRTDFTPNINYLLDAVDDHDPHHFTLYLTKNGATT